MHANLFKILAMAAAISPVHSAPVETAEGQVSGPYINGTKINDSFHVAGVRALPQR
jgi:hypothetical protein